MKAHTSLLTLCLSLTAIGCASVSVQHDYDPGYDFDRLETYDWMPLRLPAATNEMKVRRFQSAMDSEFTAKGYRRVTEQPDFLIALHASAQQKINVTDYGYHHGPRWGAREIDVTTYVEGSVFVDFVSGQSKEMFWRGIASAVMQERSPEQQEKLSAEAATKLLAKFPPPGP
jgi:hypothetical protein